MLKFTESDFSRLRQNTGLTIDEIIERTGTPRRTLYRWEKGESKPQESLLSWLREQVCETRSGISGHESFRFVDLFAGIGGLRKGFEPLGGKCVFTSEWDKYSQQTYRANFSCNHEIAGDIRKVEAEDIPAHDLLLAGFPCQPFSIAGVSKKNALKRPHGFACDAQGTLFFDVARIIAHHRPRAFLLENVKNLVSHDKGRTFEVICRVLQEELGYKVQYRVINGKAFVPQNRERIFIVGFRESNEFDLHSLTVPDIASGPRLGRILHPEDGSEGVDHRYIDENGHVHAKYTLSDHLWTYLQTYAAKHKAAGNGFGFGLVGPDDVARTLSARYYKDGSEILVRQASKNPRRLTPRECARLMGFEKPGKSDMTIPVSDTQAYKQFGNAVIVPVVEAIAKHMSRWLVDDAQACEKQDTVQEALVG